MFGENDFTIPADYSEAASKVPEGDRIVYSTLGKFEIQMSNPLPGGLISTAVTAAKMVNSRFKTHLILTQTGPIYQDPYGFKLVEWQNLERRGIYLVKIYLMNQETVYPIQVPAETKSQFRQRKKDLKLILLTLYTNRIRQVLDFFLNHHDKKGRKFGKKLKKALKASTNTLEWEAKRLKIDLNDLYSFYCT